MRYEQAVRARCVPVRYEQTVRVHGPALTLGPVSASVESATCFVTAALQGLALHHFSAQRTHLEV